jgi:hypothetical protein
LNALQAVFSPYPCYGETSCVDGYCTSLTATRKYRPIAFEDGDADLVNISYTGYRLFMVMQYEYAKIFEAKYSTKHVKTARLLSYISEVQNCRSGPVVSQ